MKGPGCCYIDFLVAAVDCNWTLEGRPHICWSWIGPANASFLEHYVKNNNEVVMDGVALIWSTRSKVITANLSIITCAERFIQELKEKELKNFKKLTSIQGKAIKIVTQRMTHLH